MKIIVVVIGDFLKYDDDHDGDSNDGGQVHSQW